jgi:hypothetical protein
MERRRTKQVKQGMTMKLKATVAFADDFGDPDFTNDTEPDCELDVDRAADELRQAGYEVNDFIEAHIEGPD